MDQTLDQIIKKQKANKRKTGGTGKLRKLATRSGVVKKQQKFETSNRIESTKINISNLDFGVTDEDIRELFSECGYIKKAAVHYDRSGRSCGTAEITFSNKEGALRAIQKYHQVPLDGRPLNINLVPSASTSAGKVSPQKNRLGARTGGGVVKRNSNGGGRFNRNGPKGRSPIKSKGSFKKNQNQKRNVTAEQLDADLEAYKKNV